jgi:hypothetical protein
MSLVPAMWAKWIAILVHAVFVEHGCTAWDDYSELWYALTITNDVCHSRKLFVCLAVTQSPDACGFHWADKCTLTHPGPAECP